MGRGGLFVIIPEYGDSEKRADQQVLGDYRSEEGGRAVVVPCRQGNGDDAGR